MSGKPDKKKASRDKKKKSDRERRKKVAKKARDAERRFASRINASKKAVAARGGKPPPERERVAEKQAVLDEQSNVKDEYPPEGADPKSVDSIFDTDTTPEYVPKDYKHLQAPPRPGEHVLTMNKRSYTPPVWQNAPGGGGPTDYFLFPGVMGYCVLKEDGTIWVCTPEPEEEHCRTDWSVVKTFLNALHERCRVINCVWGELNTMLVDEGWVNRPEQVKNVSDGKSREIDVWYPPEEGKTEKGHVEGGYEPHSRDRDEDFEQEWLDKRKHEARKKS